MNNTRKIVSPRVKEIKKEIKFIPSSNYHNHVHNKKPYNERGATYLGQLVFPMGPNLKEDVK
tara:strand:+ start:327 stop:512 length:186 start_codon:yes stop_codon:yes gene_type:complete